MSERDRRLAEKYAAKGKKSATQTSREKSARRVAGHGEPAPGSVESALRAFDPARPKETAVPRSEESVSRARAHKFRLPRLG